jgi:hypothetical protein
MGNYLDTWFGIGDDITEAAWAACDFVVWATLARWLFKTYSKSEFSPEVSVHQI